MFYNILLIIFFTVNFAYGQSDSLMGINPPGLYEYVSDETGTLTIEQADSLRNKLRSFDDSTSTQIVVYMIHTLNGEALESVSYSIAMKNKIGTRNNNGVLLLIVKDDRKIRIEVGYGLESVLTDARAGRIINDYITPHFKKGNYYKGIESGVNEIIYAVHFEKFITANPYVYEEQSGLSQYSGLIIAGAMILTLLAVIFVFAFLVSGKRGSTYSSSSSGYKSSSTAYRSISSGSSHSSSGSRGFSGGGGSFGGGGASGSW